MVYRSVLVGRILCKLYMSVIGFLHIRWGDSVDPCDTSLPKLESHLSFSFRSLPSPPKRKRPYKPSYYWHVTRHMLSIEGDCHNRVQLENGNSTDRCRRPCGETRPTKAHCPSDKLLCLWCGKAIEAACNTVVSGL